MNFRGSYQAGQPYGICDRCGFRVRFYDMRTEWSNAKVCDDCYDPRPVHLTTPKLNPGEGAAIPDARPETLETAADADLDFEFRDGTYFDPSDNASSNATELLDDDLLTLIDDDQAELLDD